MSANGKAYGPKDGGTYLDRARQHWTPIPDWVAALAGAADKSKSQGDLAKKLGCNASVISAVLSRKYTGRYDTVEAQVRRALLDEPVQIAPKEVAAKKFGPKDGGTYADRARQHWSPLPDWVSALASAADKSKSQGELARKVGCNASVISAVISRKYSGRYDTVEAQVRGALMHETANCPVFGVIARNVCIANQKLPFSAANPQRAQLYRACRHGCRHATIVKEQK